jgi:hypothetical protein
MTLSFKLRLKPLDHERLSDDAAFSILSYLRPSSFMSQIPEDQVTIWYFMDGNFAAGSIRLALREIVDDLKKAIKHMESLSYPHTRLVIWKVRGCFIVEPPPHH